MPTRLSQESNVGLQQMQLVLYQLSYQDQAETHQNERHFNHPASTVLLHLTATN